MDNIIAIHYDFSDGSEVSYLEGKALQERGESFSTHCLEFFRTDNFNAFVVNKHRNIMSVRDILKNDGRFTDREIRKAHDLRKMLVAGAFKW